MMKSLHLLLCFALIALIINPLAAQQYVQNGNFSSANVNSSTGNMLWSGISQGNMHHWQPGCRVNTGNGHVNSGDIYHSNTTWTNYKIPVFRGAIGYPDLASPTGSEPETFIGLVARKSSDASTPIYFESAMSQLTQALPIGTYKFSMHIAQQRNYVNTWNNYNNQWHIEVALQNSAQGCNQTNEKILYYNPVNITSWTNPTFDFCIGWGEDNFYDRIEIRYVYPVAGTPAKLEEKYVYIDNVSVYRTSPSTLNPGFTYTVQCDNATNQATVILTANANNTNSQWNIYPGDPNCNTNVHPTAQPMHILGGNQTSFTVPNTPGMKYFVKHGVWSTGCNWQEQRQCIEIPAFSDPVDASFTGSITAGSNTGLATVNATANANNPVSMWGLYKSQTLPSTNPMFPHNTWQFINYSLSGNSYSVSNLQTGFYYLVFHIGKNNCSQHEYTYAIYQAIQMKKAVKYELVEKGKMPAELATEEHHAMIERDVRALNNMIEYQEEMPTEDEAMMKAYPNPTTGTLKLKLDNFKGSSFQVEVIDVYTQRVLVRDDKFTQGQALDISKLRKGVYQVVVKGEGGNILMMEKVLKN